jgi:hypothetical protein
MATFRRNDCLERALPLLLDQLPSAGLEASILVVDNDPDAGALAVVEPWVARGVRYVHEPRPGIAAARNAALTAADEDLLVFIDDDEIPSDTWLATLVDCWRRFGSAAVTGPVVPSFDGDVDPWVLATEVFDRRRLTTGTELPGAATNNLLLDMRFVREHGLRFDERFGITGGSDSMLTNQLVDRGGVIRWCDEAEVVDVIPAARATRAWTMRRTVRTSNGWARIRIMLAPPGVVPALVRRTDLALRAAKLGVVGAAASVAGLVTRRVGLQARGARDLARCAGVLMAVAGVTWAEYTRPSSSVPDVADGVAA